MNSIDKLATELQKAIANGDNNKKKGYDTQAEVTRLDGDTVWVKIAGSDDETPVSRTNNANVGDNVLVRVSGGRAWLLGNQTSPATDDTVANKANQQAYEALGIAASAGQSAELARTAADSAMQSAEQASSAAASATADAATARTKAEQATRDASEAKASAESALTSAQNAQKSADSALISLSNVEDVVGVLEWITAHGTMTANGSAALDPSKVYFIVDPDGDYVVGGTHYSIVSEPKAEERTSYYTLSVDESVQNYIATHVVVDTEGLWLIPDSGSNKVLIATGAGSSYTTAGTYIIGKVNGVDTVFAKFLQTGVTMNATNSTQIAHLGYGPSSGETGVVDAPYYTLGTRKTTTTPYNSASTYAVGDLCVYNNKVYCCKTAITTAEAWDSTHWNLANGTKSLVEGSNNVAAYYNAHAEGGSTTAIGACAHAEGSGTLASGAWAHAEGYNTTASGQDSHAEGSQTTATNLASHAEGADSDATGIHGAHAEGNNTTASGNYGSHAEGDNTTASGTNGAHAEGGYTTASAEHAHAEGYHTIANGANSHAQNTYTTASGDHQTALGKFNVSDATSAVIIGNGTASNARSNALTVDWNGNVNIASGAKYKINGTNLSASDVNALPISGGTLSGGTQIFNCRIANSSSRETTASPAATGKRGITSFLSSGTMTTDRPPNANGTGTGEGTIIHCEWDNTGGWNSQLFIADNDSGNGKPFVAVRGQRSGTWTAWDRLLAKSDCADWVTAQSQSTTSYGDGYWRWREWNSGKVEIWYHGSLSLTTSESDSNGVKRYSRWFNFPNSYSLYRCTVIVNGMQEGAWYGCGGTRDSRSTVGAEPARSFQIMGYRIYAQPPTAPTNLNIYICGQKTV